MAAWAIRHRDFVKELIIDHRFLDEWVMVSMLVHVDSSQPAVSSLCSLASHSALREAC